MCRNDKLRVQGGTGSGEASLSLSVPIAMFGTSHARRSIHRQHNVVTAQPAEALRGVNRSTRDRSSLPQKALVVFQAALSLVLLAGAILMTQTLVNLEHQNFGVATANRYVLHFDPAGAGYTDGKAARTLSPN